MESKVTEISSMALKAIESSPDTKVLYDIKVKFLGKQGEFSSIMKEMGKLPKEERPAFGQLVNKHKKTIETAYIEKEAHLKQQEMSKQLQKEKLDLSLPGAPLDKGGKHPVSRVSQDIINILKKIGFSVRTGPHIEKDWYNFEALNIPADHPARDEQDTFYITKDHVLRTHTSPIQVHTMENEKPPLRILAPGAVFRCDSDISHLPNFHQIEALIVEKEVSMAHLKGTISYFVREFFGKDIKTRFRPSFFPFTEPSAEVDCSCPICKGDGCRMCKNSGWIEIGGSGLVHPNVLKMSGIDPNEWQGFAFGFGIERMAIIKYGIEDIRLLSDNDIRFLEQF